MSVDIKIYWSFFSKKKFIITRALKAIVGNKGEHEELQPKTPYIPRSTSKGSPIHEVVEHLPSGGPPSVSKSALKVVNNTLISSNEPQLQAVVSIVAQRPGSLQFVIFGP
jgi:hypothetical protein